ncbi:MAG: radical SAM protein [Geobacteraceae bacterium]|nr:radical SAM protein [Geobacteraceae bacterium]
MHVILVAIHPYPSPQAVPLANAFLKSFLATDEGLSGAVRVELRDFFVGDDPVTCAAALLGENPDAVGFSCYLWNRGSCREIAAVLRRRQPEVTLFAGGPEPTADPEGVLRESPFDFLILGEGELPFIEAVTRLCAGKPLAGAAGIALRDGEAVTATFRGPVELLDTIPSPHLAGLLPPDRYGGALWQLSRGCDFACSFCFDQKGVKGVRHFSLERVKQELAWFVKNRVPQVFVLDSTFNREMRRAKEVLRLIGRVAPHIHFHFEVRSEFIDPEMARLFARANCSLQIGLQSADPRVQQGVRRIFNAEEFTAKVALLNEAGAIFGFDLIYGLPGDTLAGFERSLDFALALYPNHLDIFPLAVLPGTELAGRADALGLSRLAAPPYTLLATPTFPAAEMGEAARLAAACDIFYSRGKAVAWFNAVLTPLDLAPSAFLKGFGHWLAEQRRGEVAEADLSDGEIWRLQRGHLTSLFAGRRLKRLLPAALDLVDYHYHYAAALLAPQPELPTDRELERLDLLAATFVLAPGARLASFNYEIVDLLECGGLELREFVTCFSRAGSWAVIYPRGGEVFTESLIEPYFRLLERLDGTVPAGKIAAELAIPAAEAASFMEFAAAEGIVRRPD